MLRLQSERPFKATEQPRVFWSIPREVFTGGVQPDQACEPFECIVELPNGFKAKVQKIAHCGADFDGNHRYMGFVSEMWGDVGKQEARDE